MSSGSGLPPHKHAAFAVISRLISCLVTEGILRAFYLPIAHARAHGVLVVLSSAVLIRSENIIIDRVLQSSDVLALVPLLHPPIFVGESVSKHGRPVGLVDPLDMFVEIYELTRTVSDATTNDTLQDAILSCLVPPPWELGQFTALAVASDPVHLWKKFVDGAVIQPSLSITIEKELQSSLDWQLLAYQSPPLCPSLASSRIEWEQSLVAGHPTHPMHRARKFEMSGLEYDWYHPRIRFVSVPTASLDMQGPFEREMRSLAAKVSASSGKALPDNTSSILMPVHELQIPNIAKKFPDVTILDSDISIKGYAQSSIRTVIVPELPGVALKLAVGVKISSALRTISHFTADLGPRFSADIVPKLAVNSKILSIECEPASAIYRSTDPDIAKHLTVILREEYQPVAGQVLIVCAALLEMDHAGSPAGVSAAENSFALNTEEKRVRFLDSYLRTACEAFIPPLIHNGTAFEAHAQNVLGRFDLATGELIGFVVRDIGGIRVHPPTLRKSTGVDFQFLSGHCAVAETVEETYPSFYHALIHSHIQRLIRVLRLHYNGVGWEMLRRHMKAVIPDNHPLQRLWLSPDNKLVLSKCLLRMRMRDSYRDWVYNYSPNMIQYRPDETLQGTVAT